MILTINTASNGVVVVRVGSVLEAAKVLQKMARDGIRCDRWELQRCA